MSLDITLHQALFGYDTGHHLLGASLPLSPDLRHLLAVATDLSGSAPSVGFEATYTGFPVSGTNFYALFCTWLAPEMPRPGCVWSHVLLIELAEFAEVRDLSIFRRLFRRPESKGWDSYEAPIRFRAEGQLASGLDSSKLNDAKKLLGALYGMPNRSIVVPSNRAAKTEDVLFALWSQQWPRLRRSFRFSTGSFADRGRSGHAFDLQVTPEANMGAWQRQGDYFNVDGSYDPDFSDTQWLGAALADLQLPETGGFREFLRTYGADLKEPRSSFAGLALAYQRLVLQPNTDWEQTLRYIGELFSDASDAVELKEWLITPRTDLDRDTETKHNLATVTFLLTSDNAGPYATVCLDFGELARRVWASNKREVLSLLAELIRQQEKSSGMAFAAAIANEVKPPELRMISEERPELLQLLLGHRPALAFHVETWQLPTHLQWRVSEILNGLSLEASDWSQIVGAMFVAGTNVGVRDAVEKAGSEAIKGTFRWLECDAYQRQLPPQAWREALASRAADRVRENELLQANQLALCSWFLSPEGARQLLNVSRRDIQALEAQPLKDVPEQLRLHSAFLLVALGLQNGGAEGVKFVVKGFFLVYEALASSNYPSESWLLLSPELPYLGVWREWDRCKKLRRAVRERFSEQKTAVVQALTEFATSPEQSTIVRKIWR
jgi:hypothetical protein